VKHSALNDLKPAHLITDRAKRYRAQKAVIGDGPRSFEHGDEEKAEGRQPYGYSGGFQFPDAEQMRLVVADVVEAELLGGAVEVFGELLDTQQVGSSGSLGVITTLEFIEHRFS